MRFYLITKGHSVWGELCSNTRADWLAEVRPQNLECSTNSIKKKKSDGSMGNLAMGLHLFMDEYIFCFLFFNLRISRRFLLHDKLRTLCVFLNICLYIHIHLEMETHIHYETLPVS